MKKLFQIFFLILIFGSYVHSHAYSAEGKPINGTKKVFSAITRIFVNQDCKENDTCDLKEVRLNVEKYRIWVVDGWHYGTSAIASYETDGVDNLENYSFVQFIRGCIFDSYFFDSYFMEDGSIRKLLGHSKAQFAEFDEEGKPKNYKTFCFPDWVIDSIDKDPVYYSFPGFGRFYARRWNTAPGSYDKKTEKYYGEEKPDYPLLYLKDATTSAFDMETWAVNTSLEFKICIYKTKDIPLETTEDNINFAAPIKCFDWQNIYIYNHETREFEMKFERDPFCLEEPSR